MPDAVLIFTFSPVQPFISEARRAADLFAGSRILVELAKAAASALQQRGGDLVFPAGLHDGPNKAPAGFLDVPNKLVATVPADHVRNIAQSAQEALLQKWREIGDSARNRLQKYNAGQDGVWNAIWQRQTDRLWEVYWASAPMTGRDDSYSEAYRRADAALNGAKRTRAFEASEEQGMKDSLSGQREALHTDGVSAMAYWAGVSGAVGTKLRPAGQERLDAIGSLKRFSDIAEKAFPSTSTVASEDFRQRVRGRIGPYRQAVEALIPRGKLYRVSSSDEWPYDGDLFYLETLTTERLRDSYDLGQVDQDQLRDAQKELRRLHREVKPPPSPYYAIIVLDGDKMGERIFSCLNKPNPRVEHQKLSQSLARFAGHVEGIVGNHLGSVVYNGGDDVLLMSPLSHAVPVAQELAQKFRQTTGATASAGIAITHHLYPLDAALAAARDAEREAKDRYGRNALCAYAVKRSGETLRVGGKWSGDAGYFGDLFADLVGHFQDGRLSSRLAYEVAEQAPTIAILGDSAARKATLKRMIGRHSTEKMPDAMAAALVDRLDTWATALDACIPSDDGSAQGFAELGRWLVLARFVAQGGGD
jgi:CRISPR-associated protein Cmr2